MEQQTVSKFEGWAVIELFGHNREAGMVTTQYFGDKAMFQVDIPELEEGREVTLDKDQWYRDTWLKKGTTVKKAAAPGRTRLISPAAVYAINPCSKERALMALEEMTPREIKIVELSKAQQLATSETPEPEEEEELDPGPFEVYEIEEEGFFFDDHEGVQHGPYQTDTLAETEAETASKQFADEQAAAAAATPAKEEFPF